MINNYQNVAYVRYYITLNAYNISYYGLSLILLLRRVDYVESCMI